MSAAKYSLAFRKKVVRELTAAYPTGVAQLRRLYPSLQLQDVLCAHDRWARLRMCVHLLAQAGMTDTVAREFLRKVSSKHLSMAQAKALLPKGDGYRQLDLDL